MLLRLGDIGWENDAAAVHLVNDGGHLFLQALQRRGLTGALLVGGGGERELFEFGLAPRDLGIGDCESLPGRIKELRHVRELLVDGGSR